MEWFGPSYGINGWVDSWHGSAKILAVQFLCQSAKKTLSRVFNVLEHIDLGAPFADVLQSVSQSHKKATFDGIVYFKS